MSSKRKLDICFTPELMHLFDLANKKIVVIDVFRATSAICVFLNNGGTKVIPVSTIDEAIYFKQRLNKQLDNYIFAAERNGHIAPGFEFGNSPLSYDNKNLNNKSLIITTTNGTKAIEMSKNNNKGLILASFLNLTSVVNYLLNSDNSDILLVCSGWKGRECIEDILLAGLISQKLDDNYSFSITSDSVLISKLLYKDASQNLFNYILNSSYMKRLNLKEDIKYCLQQDTMQVVPIWHEDDINSQPYFSGLF